MARDGVGRFVVLEGGEATGKSTQTKRLVERLRDRGHDVVATFEPGDTGLGTDLRAVLLHGDAPVDPMAEALLLAADRGMYAMKPAKS